MAERQEATDGGDQAAGRHERGRARSAESLPQFAVHEHVRNPGRFDLRLQAGPMLRGWEIHHGPAVEPGESREAVEVESEWLERLLLRGAVPAGETGVESIRVLDHGRYRLFVDGAEVHGDLAMAGDADRFEIDLQAPRFRGRYALERLPAPGKRNHWRLTRLPDPAPDAHNAPADPPPT